MHHGYRNCTCRQEGDQQPWRNGARGKLLAVKRASGKPACLRLPFIVGSRTESDTLFWNVPATGGYQGGYATGDYMAITLLKRFRSDECSLAGHA